MRKGKKIIFFVMVLIIVLIIINITFIIFLFASKNRGIDEIYNPVIKQQDFTAEITNPYFNMPIRKKMVFETETEDGKERIEILIPGWTKEIMGIETLVFWDRVYLNDELIEDTRDYIAQDKEGNVWYFGENVDNYIDGVLTDHHGSWIGGVDGAKPGIWMKANPKVGDKYRQEYYKGKAEDMGRVEGLGMQLTTPAGTFVDCIKIFEWTPLESATAYKYHCREAGGVVLEEDKNEKVELVEIDVNGAACIKLSESYADEGVLPYSDSNCLSLMDLDAGKKEELKKITEEDAARIALNAISGRVTDITIEKKFGKFFYVIEIESDDSSEKDVIIDINTGEVLNIET